MKFDIKALMRKAGEELEIVFDASHGIAVEDFEDYHFTGPLLFNGTLTSEDSKVLHLRGMASIDWVSSCVRCLREVRRTENVEIDERIYPEDYGRRMQDEYGLQDEGDFLTDPEELHYHDGSSVALEKLLVDALLLNLSLGIYCEEDCPGLCPTCGLRLDDPNCHCTQQQENTEDFVSAFDKLRDLL